ncbi:MAG: flavin reductase family protein [Thermoguttaceae bacterium]|nr:flavin reductase family protein [Thermoguttaceae bacterium]MBR3219048.1 flavin reductase family protein [Thermoguttaceae bacterium]
MAKKNLKMRVMVAPTPTIIAAAYDENGKADACTLAFYSPISHVPPCVVIGINANLRRKTLKSILHSGAFTIGYPSADQVKEADYIGVDSGYDTDKLANVGYTVTPGQTVHAPVIDQMKLSLECKVVHTVTVGGHTQITGQITNIQAEEEILDEKGRVVLEKLNPLIYDEEGFSYHFLGEPFAEAFRTGAQLKKSLGR